jgi:hypothetical protein
MGQNDQVTIVNNRASFRLSVIEAVRQAADELAQPLEQGSIVGPDLAGIPILSRGVLGEVLNRVKASPLPAIDLTSAEVKTPADVYVDVICPECDLPTRILVQLTAVLETTREAGSTHEAQGQGEGQDPRPPPAEPRGRRWPGRARARRWRRGRRRGRHRPAADRRGQRRRAAWGGAAIGRGGRGEARPDALGARQAPGPRRSTIPTTTRSCRPDRCHSSATVGAS